MEEKQKMLLQLQEVLRVKNFSLDVKARIKRVLLETWDTETNKKIFFDIIEGLKKIEMFKINTRKQLLKIATIKANLDSQTCGYVTSTKDIAVVVKGKTEDSTTYHELVHVSQPENAYHINQEDYPFSELFEKAMKEGEAVFRQRKYSRKEIVIQDGNNPEMKATIINREMEVHPISYYIFQELYEDMIGLLGEEKVEEWKHHGYDKDMILEFDKYVSQEKHIKFRVLYQW